MHEIVVVAGISSNESDDVIDLESTARFTPNTAKTEEDLEKQWHRSEVVCTHPRPRTALPVSSISDIRPLPRYRLITAAQYKSLIYDAILLPCNLSIYIRALTRRKSSSVSRPGPGTTLQSSPAADLRAKKAMW